jgi:hypothetical protein
MTVPTRSPVSACPGLSGKDSSRPAGPWALLLLVAASAAATAQPAAPMAAAAKTVVAQASAGPGWSELSTAQRDVLQPLAATWPSLSAGHKRKWLEVTRSYGALPAEEQTKMQGRMKEWVALSPQQRAQARINFARTRELSKELSAEEKKAKWEAYQSLSAEEKRKLAAKAPTRPVGAAPAAKPVSRQKLAALPAAPAPAASKPAPKIELSQPMEAAPGLLPVATPDLAHGAPAQPH